MALLSMLPEQKVAGGEHLRPRKGNTMRHMPYKGTGLCRPAQGSIPKDEKAAAGLIRLKKIISVV